MIASRLQSWRRSAVFSGTNLLAAAALYAVAIGPFVELLQDQRRHIEQTAAALVRMTSLLERKPVITSMTESAADWSTKPFLQGDTLSLLNADLLAKLRQVAERHQITFNSVATRPQQTWRGYSFVGARVEFLASSSRASELLSAIEAGLPFLFIQSAKLAAAAASDSSEELVMVTLDVYGATRWRKH